jgi:hypothetical protein
MGEKCKPSTGVQGAALEPQTPQDGRRDLSEVLDQHEIFGEGIHLSEQQRSFVG